jgi:Zyg-11 protein homolog
VDGAQKLFLGDLGAIQTMLNLINERLNRKAFDDVMEVAWSTMWNVTDETPVNCERFLDGKGMEYFLGCLRVSLTGKQASLMIILFVIPFADIP